MFYVSLPCLLCRHIEEKNIQSVKKDIDSCVFNTSDVAFCKFYFPYSAQRLTLREKYSSTKLKKVDGKAKFNLSMRLACVDYIYIYICIQSTSKLLCYRSISAQGNPSYKKNSL